VSSPISEFTSHVDGRNARVSIYPDRIEWRRNSFTGRGDSTMIPVKQIQGVETRRAGLFHTFVQVKTSADTIKFRVGKAKAAAIKATIAGLIT
jgi:hypothetical protein